MRVRCSYCRREIAVLADAWVQWFHAPPFDIGPRRPEVGIQLVHAEGRGCTYAERGIGRDGLLLHGMPAAETLAQHLFEDKRVAPPVLHRLHSLKWQRPDPTCAGCGTTSGAMSAPAKGGPFYCFKRRCQVLRDSRAGQRVVITSGGAP